MAKKIMKEVEKGEKMKDSKMEKAEKKTGKKC